MNISAKIYFWNVLQFVEKEDTLIDMKGSSYCIDVFKIAWLGCGGFQKNSNAEFSQSWN